jgi:hypothetical protein
LTHPIHVLFLHVKRLTMLDVVHHVQAIMWVKARIQLLQRVAISFRQPICFYSIDQLTT